MKENHISIRIKEVYETFPDLNQEADRIQKQILKVYKVYRTNNFHRNHYIMTKLCDKLIPKAWSWSVECCYPDFVPVLGRFFPLIQDETGSFSYL